MSESNDVARLSAFVDVELPSHWAPYPGGWPGQIEAALIDAVLGIRARYGTPDSGVRAAINRWRTHRSVQLLDDLSQIVVVPAIDFGAVLGVRQKVSGGAFKSEAIQTAAHRLLAAGVQTSAQVDPNSYDQQRAYTGVTGLGPVTWKYFLMLLGNPGIKADRWIIRFVSSGLNATCLRQKLTPCSGRSRSDWR